MSSFVYGVFVFEVVCLRTWLFIELFVYELVCLRTCLFTKLLAYEVACS